MKNNNVYTLARRYFEDDVEFSIAPEEVRLTLLKKYEEEPFWQSDYRFLYSGVSFATQVRI